MTGTLSNTAISVKRDKKYQDNVYKKKPSKKYLRQVTEIGIVSLVNLLEGTMSLTIRERCSAVAKCLQKKGSISIRAIAEATGLSKSSVGRHQQAIASRAKYPESSWWETEVGGAWLKLLVLGVVYYFGIKQGMGADSLSEFLKAMRLERHVGCSATALRSLKQKMKQAIVGHHTAFEEHCQPSEGQGICVGGDETFFYLPILVMVELSTG